VVRLSSIVRLPEEVWREILYVMKKLYTEADEAVRCLSHHRRTGTRNSANLPYFMSHGGSSYSISGYSTVPAIIY
jgi:hypothetical protein